MANRIRRKFEKLNLPKALPRTYLKNAIIQIEDSGNQIPKEPAGKRRKKRWILQEYTGSHRNMEAVFRPENIRIFSGDIRPVSGGKHRKVIGMHRKKSGNFPAGILLPCPGDFQCIPAGTVPYSLIWKDQFVK